MTVAQVSSEVEEKGTNVGCMEAEWIEFAAGCLTGFWLEHLVPDLLLKGKLEEEEVLST